MRWIARVALVSTVAVVACGYEPADDHTPTFFHIDGEARRTITVCADSDELHTTFVVRNPMWRTINVGFSRIGTRKDVVVVPSRIKLAPNEETTVRLEYNALANVLTPRDFIEVTDLDKGEFLHQHGLQIHFVFEHRTIELSLADWSAEGLPRIIVRNPTPMSAYVTLSSTGKWEPSQKTVSVMAYKSVITSTHVRQGLPPSSAEEATFRVEGTPCSSKPLKEPTLVIRR